MSSSLSRVDVDVVVVGGGHNALVAAALLAETGKRVLVIERLATLGGLGGVETGVGGISIPRGSSDLSLWRSNVSNTLGLEAHGLRMVEAPVSTFVPARGASPALTLYVDVERTSKQLRSVSSSDAGMWPRFVTWLSERVAELETLLVEEPSVQGLSSLARFPELLRAVSTPLRETLDQWFENETLKGALAQRALFASRFGPWALGTGLGLVYQHAGTTPERFAPVVRAQGRDDRVCCRTRSLLASSWRRLLARNHRGLDLGRRRSSRWCARARP